MRHSSTSPVIATDQSEVINGLRVALDAANRALEMAERQQKANASDCKAAVERGRGPLLAAAMLANFVTKHEHLPVKLRETLDTLEENIARSVEELTDFLVDPTGLLARKTAQLGCFGRGHFQVAGSHAEPAELSREIKYAQLLEQCEEERAEAVSAREMLEKELRAKDCFLATLAHELRTPLTPAKMITHLLRKDKRLPDDMRALVDILERNIGLQKCLVDDIHDISSISNGKFSMRAESCDVHRLINFAVEIMQPEASEKEIAIEFNLLAATSSLVADPIRLQQVLWNLIGNAIKFTPPKGRIVIHTREVYFDREPSQLRIEVADSGIGLSAEALEKIFIPFEQGASNGRGLGLGLAIAKSIVGLHGGWISASSPGLGQGAVFTVHLPREIPQSGEESRDP